MRLPITMIFSFLLIASFVSAAECDLTVSSRDTSALLVEIPSLNDELAACPMVIPSAVAKIVKGDLQINIERTDGTTTSLSVLTQGNSIKGVKIGTTACLRQVDIDEATMDAILGSGDRATTLQALYSGKSITIRGCTLWSKLTTSFARPVSRWFVKKTLPPAPGPQEVPAPVQGSLQCEFYNAPTKKIVTCAAYNAGDTFCANVMGSRDAKAITCEENGLVLCSVPCDSYSTVKLTNRCGFDINRARGTQAPPIGTCPAPAVQAAPAAQRPAGCEETYLPGYREYAPNKALWDSYSADSTGVCQVLNGKTPSGTCKHTIQLSVGSTPYYLCWY